MFPTETKSDVRNKCHPSSFRRRIIRKAVMTLSSSTSSSSLLALLLLLLLLLTITLPTIRSFDSYVAPRVISPLAHSSSPCCPSTSSSHRRHYLHSQSQTRLHSSSGGRGSDNNNKNDRNNNSSFGNQSAAAYARREEERRRRERRNDVVIGKTSAIPGVVDYRIDPRETEREWMNQANDVKREVFVQTERGMEMLKMLKIEEANDAFDRVYKLKPNAYVWHAGVTKFYLNDWIGASRLFVHNAELYETKFGTPASEERIWRDACELKLRHERKSRQRRKRKKDEIIHNDGEGGGGSKKLMVAQIPEEEEILGEDMIKENRKVIRIARDLFSASVANDHSTVVLSRAKLRSICGEYGTPGAQLDRKMWKLSSWYYLGLHYDAIGDFEESKACMKMALRLCPSTGNGNDIIHTLPVIHMARRDWYDDDEFVEDSGRSHEASDSNNSGGFRENGRLGGKGKNTDPVLMRSIRESIGKMRLAQLQDALRARGLKTSGSKDTLQERLYHSLIEDAGLD